MILVKYGNSPTPTPSGNFKMSAPCRENPSAAIEGYMSDSRAFDKPVIATEIQIIITSVSNPDLTIIRSDLSQTLVIVCDH